MLAMLRLPESGYSAHDNRVSVNAVPVPFPHGRITFCNRSAFTISELDQTDFPKDGAIIM
jgi:hypothetical protein